jgi:hypothetical protein
MKYKVSASRVKILLWVLVVLQIFFSYSILQGMYIRHTINIGLIQTLFYWFNMIAPIFLLWAFYQNKRQNNNLLKTCYILSITLIIIRLISIILAFNLLAFVYVLLYVDFGMYFKSKITKSI